MLRAQFDLAARCSQAVRIVLNAERMYPGDDEKRDALLSSTLDGVRKDNSWGKATPSDLNMLIAKTAVDSFPKSSRPDQRELALANGAAMCSIQSFSELRTGPVNN